MENPANDADSAARGPSIELVFVYGTLMRGMANHQQLAGADFVGVRTVAGLQLYDLGPFPMAIRAGDDPEARLSGEVYAMSPELLAALDRFEGAPRLYERQRQQLEDGCSVWVYVGRPQQVRHVRRLSSWPPTSAPPGPESGPEARRA